ncbi:hypothetical protein Pcar_0808 [Syntrophotalea carbinolica DSM 2380]|uniref:Uracil-DNA glycosylase-like domain-containing protein n=1 Tax=Syntrophotalea carbinolica (strain DSM 2380 / NBRC 103641 / GraBd1) TaxID=338963 RepID=Q3A6E2_SYNC1|nr:hypothetical protein [Syntrophotalea carbinolica]ABA88065.1 hypothetical protein Pcar_0808 [Syntrophotalea carbinolica DSM 2380]
MQELANEYREILKDLDVSFLDPHHPSGRREEGLSGLFLTSIPKQYKAAKNKIMIIGRETAGWNVLNRNIQEEFTTLSSYIEKALTKHREFFEKQLNIRNSRGQTFHNFTRAVAKKCGKEGIIYSNLFCFDWKKGSPIGCPYFETIKKFSEQLVKLQIRFFAPDIIIFANGMDSVPYRREFFPIAGDNKVCHNGRDYSDQGIPNGQLWEFDLFDSIRCFRIHHPSAYAQKAKVARKFLVDLLPSA